MSSIAARSVFRAATRRQASTATAIRNAARAVEPHPYQRVVNNSKPDSPAYGKMAKNAATRMVFFAPGFALMLGWPWLSKMALNGHV